MVLKQGKRLDLEKRLDRQFLREVSRYLNDLRLIQNIFNEYAIYIANLETDGENLLDANKLLAILIYKNFYPRDFEHLHRGIGNLATILNYQDKLIALGENRCRAELTDLEEKLEAAELQTPSDLRELRQIYAMALIEKIPLNFYRVSLTNSGPWIASPNLVDHDSFQEFIEASYLLCHHFNNGQQRQLDNSKLQSEVHSQKSYTQREEEIEHKASNNKNEMLRKIHNLKLEIAKLRTTRLKELLRLNANHMHDIFETFGENGELARFLVLEGYIDDTYYQYTSLFHSGRLSPHDNKFLIQIRAFITPEPDFSIDNPKEVIAAMRDEDFRQSYTLNIKLVDALLSNPSRYADQTQKFFEYLSSEFDSCEDFFASYYTNGHHVDALVSKLANEWKGLVPSVIASPNNISHVSQLIKNLPEASLVKIAEDFGELRDFTSKSLPEILINLGKIEPQRIACLGVEVEDLAAIKEHPEIVRFMFKKELFKLSISNLEYIYQTIFGEADLKPMQVKNFTTIRSLDNAVLMKRVMRDFETYFADVLLGLDENCEEEAPAILSIIQHETINQDKLRSFLIRQTTSLPTLKGVPKKSLEMLFELNIIEPSWANCLDFIKEEEFKANSLTQYLDQDVVRSVILQQPIPNEPDFLQLRQFLLNANSLTDIAYRKYIQALPKPFKMPPEELEPCKLRILIDEEKITFSEQSFDAFIDNRDLQVLFVANNINAYLENTDSFDLDDDFLEDLLRSEIDDEAKICIVQLMNLKELVGLPDRAALIGPIIQKTNIELFNFESDIVKSLIENSEPIETQVSLLNQTHKHLDDNEVFEILAKLPKPFSDIQIGHKTPKLDNNPENLKLVEWLDTRNIISSWSESKLFGNEIKVNLYRS